MIEREWNGCYDESWKSVATEESTVHPAKFARGLIRRIYQHLRDHYQLPPGSIVVDPFGGVANGALDAMEMGYAWIGCELEERFVEIGRKNIAHWKRFWPDAQAELVQGDSRELCSVLGPVLAGVVVSSPPFAGEQRGGGIAANNGIDGNVRTGVNCGYQNQASSDGNLAKEEGETFWQASAQILAQCYAILKPGGIAVFVTKDFVRKGQRVTFSEDWLKLCTHTGFEPVEWIKASLVKQDRHPGLFGEEVVKQTERKSFFRRLAEKKGSPRIDHEDLLIVRKPHHPI